MSNNVEIAIGEKIKSLRKKREITQEQLAEYLNISFQSVSKWECGDAYPDVTMLPKIALFFGVTTDELLCIDKLKEQEDINKYFHRKNEALLIGDTKEAVAAMREVNAKYPGKFELMKELADILRIDTVREPDVENKQNAYKEIISLGEKIRAECKDDKIRREILKNMCVAYRNIGESEKAIHLANANFNSVIQDSDAIWLTQLLDGDKLIEQQQSNMIEFGRCFFGALQTLSKDFAPEDRLAICNNILDMYLLIFKDGDFLFYNLDMSFLYMNIAGIYMALKNDAKVLENIINSANHAIAFDETAFSAPFTSPLVNKIASVGLRYWKSYKGNQAFNLLKRLDENLYDVIRNTPEFMDICENLKKHAKDDDLPPKNCTR
jgi:transcriptional regulator with XRE-family HTH domain